MTSTSTTHWMQVFFAQGARGFVVETPEHAVDAEGVTAGGSHRVQEGPDRTEDIVVVVVDIISFAIIIIIIIIIIFITLT